MTYKVTLKYMGDDGQQHHMFDTTWEGEPTKYLDGCLGPSSAFNGYKKTFPSLPDGRHFYEFTWKPELAHMNKNTRFAYFKPIKE